jgi:hypothetical protein
MTIHHVLIDYENVQPENVAQLQGHPVDVFVFVGANQAKIPFELASAVQSLGARGRYIKIAGSGRNALDFHIAYYLGELASADPTGTFYVVSKDKGFDPLLRHVQDRGATVRRLAALAELPLLQLSTDRPEDEKVAAIVKNLAGLGHSRPRKVKTLSNMINALFSKNLSDEELMRLIEMLSERGYVRTQNGRVSYNL